MDSTKKGLKTMERAKTGLVINAPFYASVALKMPVEPDPTCQTLWTDGRKIGYNPEHFADLSIEEARGKLASTLLHVMNKHHLRRGEREPGIWNVSCDHVVNRLLDIDWQGDKQNGVLPWGKLPEGAPMDSDFDNWCAEEVYKFIRDRTPDPEGEPEESGDNSENDSQDQNNQDQDSESDQTNPDPGECGEVRDFQGTPDEQAEEEQKVNVQLKQAAQTAKMQGDFPAHLARLIAQLVKNRIPWKEVLVRFLSESVRNDYTWKIPNRRYVQQGFYLPALEEPELDPVIVIIDTSGSIGEHELRKFLSEVQGITDTFQTEIELLFVDTEVVGHQTLEPGEDIAQVAKPAGGGGTDFRPGFDFIKEKDLNGCCVIYFTDLYCNSYPEENQVEIPILWASTREVKPGEMYGVPPFGELLFVDLEED